jgi:asparagine synthase (glutamine-hydrolysing)
VDQTRGVAILFNDRYGMHRIYWHESPDAFYFSAEAKGILAVRPELRSLTSRGLGEFIACGCVLENRTLFPHVSVLPPASAWAFRNGTLEQRRTYFSPREWEEQSTLDPESYYKELRDTFADILPRYFGGGTNSGMSVTGGLDTRMILAWHKPAPRSLPCYSFGSMYRDSQDVVIGRRLAQACGQQHQVIPVGQDFLSRFASHAERSVYLTDGCTEVSHAVDLYVNSQAAQIAPVRMTGNYGSEVLRGVRAFKPVEPAPGLFAAGLAGAIDEARSTYSQLAAGHPLSFAVFKQAPWHHYGLLALEQTQLAVRSPFLDNTLVRTVFRAPLTELASVNASLRLIRDGDPALANLRTDRGISGNGGSPLAAALRQWLTFTVKSEYAYDYGMPHWVARADSLAAPLRLERLFLGRHKFYHFRIWYRQALASYVRAMLLDPLTLGRPYLEHKQVEALVRDHLAGRGNYTTEIHKLLTLELIQRTLLDSPSS